MIIDTHAHLDFPDFQNDLDDVVDLAAKAGVTRILSIGTDVESSRKAVALAERYPAVYAVIGIHPNDAFRTNNEEPEAIAALRELATHPKVVAIGETGLDYYRLPSMELTRNTIEALGNEQSSDVEATVEDGAIKAAQAILFEQQLDLAVELGLNVVIHQRGDCREDTLRILAPYREKLRAVFHCFSGTLDEAKETVDLGYLISFTGIVTFKNGVNMQEIAAWVPADSYMVETDCPFLAPAPHRGKRCEPAYTRLVAEKVAALRKEPLEKVAADTTATAEAFFRFNR